MIIQSSLSTGNSVNRIFLFQGNQGNQWNHFKEEFPTVVGSEFTILFLATKGWSFKGDIAVDDILVKTGMCKEEQTGKCKEENG